MESLGKKLGAGLSGLGLQSGDDGVSEGLEWGDRVRSFSWHQRGGWRVTDAEGRRLVAPAHSSGRGTSRPGPGSSRRAPESWPRVPSPPRPVATGVSQCSQSPTLPSQAAGGAKLAVWPAAGDRDWRVCVWVWR